MKHLEELEQNIYTILNEQFFGDRRLQISPELFLALCNVIHAIRRAEGMAFAEWFDAFYKKLFDISDAYLRSGPPQSFYCWLFENTEMAEWFEQNPSPFDDPETTLGWISVFRERRNALPSV